MSANWILTLAVLGLLASVAGSTEIKLKPGLKITKPGKYTVVVPNALIPSQASAAALEVRGNNIEIDFKNATVTGTPVSVAPDQRKGIGIFVRGNNVTIRRASFRGYKVGLHAADCRNLKILDCDFSYNWKQKLKSTMEKEDLSDWMSFHHNEKGEWLQHGCGIYLDGCEVVEVRRTRIRGGQSGLLMNRTNDSSIQTNDFSFLSALGLGMYRSSNNKIRHNNIDFCVRGYSHGVYNRGQDSSGILIYEQSCQNLFEYNSVTHGGDGFFLWAGQTTMDSGKGGCNDNIVRYNDFSHAPTNGIEATFSKGNQYIKNLVLDCWHGVWGGYSFESLIQGNVFGYNGEGIAIEHGQDNLILENSFFENFYDIRLWQNSNQDPNWGYPKHRDTRSRDYLLQGNSFRNAVGASLHLGGVDGLVLRNNQFLNPVAYVRQNASATRVSLESNLLRGPVADAFLALSKEPAEAETNRIQKEAPFAGKPRVQPNGNADLRGEPEDYESYMGSVRVEDAFRLKGVKIAAPFDRFYRGAGALPVATTSPSKGPPVLPRGRRYILVDEWGPYDFQRPLLWPRTPVGDLAPGKKIRFEVLGPAGTWKLKSAKGIRLTAKSGKVPGWIEAQVEEAQANDFSIQLEYVGGAIVDVLGNNSAKGKPYAFGWQKFSVPIKWDVRFWNFDKDTEDPRNQPDAFRARINSPMVHRMDADELAFNWWSAPAPKVSADYFATIADGSFNVAKGDYELEVTADDGVRVFLDGKKLIDEWKYSPPATYTVKVNLGGQHLLRVEHFELNGFATLQVRIRKPQ